MGSANTAPLMAMDIEGIDVAVMYGPRGRQILCHDELAPVTPRHLPEPITWAHDYCKTDSRRLKFAAQIAMHDVSTAVAEVRHCVSELRVHDIIGYATPRWKPPRREGVLWQ